MGDYSVSVSATARDVRPEVITTTTTVIIITIATGPLSTPQSSINADTRHEGFKIDRVDLVANHANPTQPTGEARA